MEFDDRYRQSQRPKFDCLLFDLDDTLYPYSSGIASSCLKNIQDYMVEKLGIEEGKISELSNLLYKNYGTTMAGLRAVGYQFDYDEYHSFVHGKLPYENLKPDPILKNILQNLPIRKLIFTNGDKIHAIKVLKRLGLEDCFEGIICFETLNPPVKIDEETPQIFDIIKHFSLPEPGVELPKTPVLCKPSFESMDFALKIANIDPQKTIFFDDSVRNIQAGKLIGLHTVLVGNSHRIKGADYALETLHNMRQALPELWVEAEKWRALQYHSGKVALETFVSA
ncbi:hypothetical protein LUZ60_003806 [Juncus effusus]|nr:hypothetical protein LUZ60_003806 [Juncus effusus]